MQFSFSTGTKMSRAPKVLIYGVEGIGKSTFASKFPDPLFIDTEGSTVYLDVNRFDPAPASWQQLLDMVTWARDHASLGSTLVIDTLDWAERMCCDAVCAENNWASIESPGYGQGYKQAYEKFTKLLDILTEVSAKGITVVCCAHAKLVKVEQPDAIGSYDKWGMKLIDTRNTSIASLCKEWADAVLFANYETIIEYVGTGSGASEPKAKARGNKRVLYCNHDATYDAKNRWGLPQKVPFEFESIINFIPSAASYGFVQSEALPQVTQPQTAPVQPVILNTSVQPAAKPWVSQIRSLLASSGISEPEFLMMVSSQGYGTKEMPLEAYPEDTGNHFVAVFDKIRAVIEADRASVPIK